VVGLLGVGSAIPPYPGKYRPGGIVPTPATLGFILAGGGLPVTAKTTGSLTELFAAEIAVTLTVTLLGFI